MRQEELVGKAQTVLGLVDPDSLGITLPHEHILITFESLFKPPQVASEQHLAYQPISLENLNWVRHNFTKSLDNLRLQDEELLTEELMFYKKAGGNTIVELTCTSSLGRDPRGLMRIARATGLNIIVGSGYYETYTGYENSIVAQKSEEALIDHIVRDITVGIDETGARAGIIGENGMYWPFSDLQRKVLRVVARAQGVTGAAINIHLPCYASTKLPYQKDHEDIIMEVVKTLGDAGADLSRTVISHIDICCLTSAFRKELAMTGCYLEYDVFGVESYMDRDASLWASTPNDWQRVEEIEQLIVEGYLNQILISCDHCVKHTLRGYGGWGYDHILTSVVPLMKFKGISDKQINTLLIENPKRILTFAPPKE